MQIVLCYEQFFVWTNTIWESVPSDTDNLVMFKVLNLVKCLIVVIQFMNNINSAIYRQVVPSQVYVIKVSEGTACVTWNEEYVYGIIVIQHPCAIYIPIPYNFELFFCRIHV